MLGLTYLSCVAPFMICGRTSLTPCSSLVAHSLHYSNSGVRWGYAQFINIQVLYFQVLHIEESKYVCRVGRGFKGFAIVDVVQSIVVYSMPSMLGVPRSQPRYWFCCSFFMEIFFFFFKFSLCAQQKNCYLERDHYLTAGHLVQNVLLDIFCHLWEAG